MIELLAFARPFITPFPTYPPPRLAGLGLTSRQLALIRDIGDYWHEHGFAPCFRDLAEVDHDSAGAVRWVESNSVVRDNLRRLRRLGVVDFDDRISRSVRLRS